jgi:hypothetical protein
MKLELKIEFRAAAGVIEKSWQKIMCL